MGAFLFCVPGEELDRVEKKARQSLGHVGVSLFSTLIELFFQTASSRIFTRCQAMINETVTVIAFSS